MIDHFYLQKGIIAKARFHKAGSRAGHLGAGVLAGYFLGEDYPDLPKTVMKGIQGEEALWSSIGRTGIRATRATIQTIKSQYPFHRSSA